MKFWHGIGIASILLALLLAAPVLAAEPGPGDGGFHFGPYTFEAGTTYSGDQVVFGNATMEEASVIDGNLMVMGPLDMAEKAALNGSLFVLGPATLAGKVKGDVAVLGPLTLAETAYIAGDVSVTGPLTRAQGAVIEGNVNSAGSGFTWGPSWPGNGNTQGGRPQWLVWLWKIVRAGVALVIFVLLALLLAAVWPDQLARMAETIGTHPLPSLGIGLLTLIGVLVIGTGLLITLCLAPVALLGFTALSLALAVGWIALGQLVGEHLLRAIQSHKAPSPLWSAVLGTFLLTLMGVLLNLIGFCLYAPVVYGLASIGLGALVLTRVGSRPYLSRGTGYVPPMAPPAPVDSPPTPVPPAPVDIPPTDVPPAGPAA